MDLQKQEKNVQLRVTEQVKSEEQEMKRAVQKC